jgi:uncharacterized protein YggE
MFCIDGIDCVCHWTRIDADFLTGRELRESLGFHMRSLVRVEPNLLYDRKRRELVTNPLASLTVVLMLTTPVLAQQPPAPPPPSVVTTGEGLIKRAPDRAWVTVAAESRAKTPQEAQRANATVMSAVMQKIKGAGIPQEAVQTAAFDLQPEFDYANNRQTLRGYVARNSVEVRVDDLPKLGEILEGVVGAGATNVSGVRFDVKDRAAAERDALNKAVADARARADAAASGAGLKVERVLRIQEQRAMPLPEPRVAMMRESMQASSGQPPVVAGEIEIRASVTLTASVR